MSLIRHNYLVVIATHDIQTWLSFTHFVGLNIYLATTSDNGQENFSYKYPKKRIKKSNPSHPKITLCKHLFNQFILIYMTALKLFKWIDFHHTTLIYSLTFILIKLEIINSYIYYKNEYNYITTWGSHWINGSINSYI